MLTTVSVFDCGTDYDVSGFSASSTNSSRKDDAKNCKERYTSGDSRSVTASEKTLKESKGKTSNSDFRNSTTSSDSDSNTASFTDSDSNTASFGQTDSGENVSLVQSDQNYNPIDSNGQNQALGI